jgi:alkylation response protein AidB-like acyl-CoA dehydrogenase
MNMTHGTNELHLAERLGPALETANADAESTCRVNQNAIKMMRENGLLAMTIPAEYGGLELDALDGLKVIEALSYFDSAVGWSTMIYAKTAHLGAAMPEHHARDLYRVTRQGEVFECPITAGAAAPTGEGRKVDGGLRVTGRWAWGSGTHHADWIAGGTLVEDQGDIARLPGGAPAVHLVFFRREDVTLHNNWDPSGLRGTGSGDFEVTDIFVPDGRWMVIGAPNEVTTTPLYRFPAFGYFAAAVASVPLGIARRALDDFADIAASKVPTGKVDKHRTSALTQLDYGQAEAQVIGARQMLWSSVAETWQKTIGGDEITIDDRKQLRLSAVQATILCTQAVDLLYNAAGGTALQGDCSMQKHFRDIHAATQHRQVSREFLRVAGGIRLDGESAGPL